MTDRLLQAVATRPIVMDGAMGTRLIERGLDLRHDDPALWNRTHPEIVSEIHSQDVAAGAEAIVTNTFGANRTWLDRFNRGCDAAALNRAAVALARAAAGPGRFVLGAIGPTAGDDALLDQVAVLVEAGVDAILFETHSAERAVHAVRLVARDAPRPILVSLVAWPEKAAELARLLQDMGASVLGANCQNGPDATLAVLQALAGATALPLLARPSAGVPGAPPATPTQFAAMVPALLDLGVRLLGGCCGTDEAHVAAIRAACYDLSVSRNWHPPDPPETRSA